ncbi:MAG: SRPBCC domain-containing protein [Bacteroidetes bacterium]|nr:SRPBCC domain-containing protein [Bacteroidota bacterium]
MAKTILQTVVFKNTTPETLYDIYMDAKKHSKATRGKANISSKIGSWYSAWDGYISGKTFQLMKGKMILQSWRSSDFNSNDLDSTLILQFEKKGSAALLHMVHANVPNHQYAGVKTGWNDFYWKPWKKYLAEK